MAPVSRVCVIGISLLGLESILCAILLGVLNGCGRMSLTKECEQDERMSVNERRMRARCN